jgi:hypothetical protein
MFGLWRVVRIDETLPRVYEHPRRRRLSPIVIAVVVILAAVAGTGSYLLVRQYLDQSAEPAAGPPRSSNPVTSTSTDTRDPCPQFTVDAVKAAGRPGKLDRILYVEVAREGTNGAEAWICRDSDGVMYYQGHVKDAPATVADSRVTILLGAPIKGTVAANGSTYTATNPTPDGRTTQYVVSRDALTLIAPSGTRTDYTVVRSSP